MANWACRRCDGDGMYFDEQRKRYVICDCPSGHAKRKYLKQTPEERRAETKARRRREKREKKEGAPF